MSKAVAVGSATKVATDPGTFSMNWVTVWGVYVPPSIMHLVLWDLELRGFEAKDLGHTIQVKWDAEDPDRVERARETIKNSIRDWCLVRDNETKEDEQ